MKEKKTKRLVTEVDVNNHYGDDDFIKAKI